MPKSKVQSVLEWCFVWVWRVGLTLAPFTSCGGQRGQVSAQLPPTPPFTAHPRRCPKRAAHAGAVGIRAAQGTYAATQHPKHPRPDLCHALAHWCRTHPFAHGSPTPPKCCTVQVSPGKARVKREKPAPAPKTKGFGVVKK